MYISVVLPAYKEADNLLFMLPALHDCFRASDFEYELLVINTQKAMDNTEEICKANGAVNIFREGGNFYGDAIRTGFNKATGKYIIIMDCDGSHDPSEILKMVSIAEDGADLVIGSRYVKNGTTNNNIILRSMSLFVNIIYRVAFNLKVKDVSNSFRVYKSYQVKPLELSCDNFDLVEEILIRMRMANPDLKIVEHPIVFDKRKHGESKRDLFKFTISYIKTIRNLLLIKKSASK